MTGERYTWERFREGLRTILGEILRHQPEHLATRQGVSRHADTRRSSMAAMEIDAEAGAGQ